MSQRHVAQARAVDIDHLARWQMNPLRPKSPARSTVCQRRHVPLNNVGHSLAATVPGLAGRIFHLPRPADNAQANL